MAGALVCVYLKVTAYAGALPTAKSWSMVVHSSTHSQIKNAPGAVLGAGEMAVTTTPAAGIRPFNGTCQLPETQMFFVKILLLQCFPISELFTSSWMTRKLSVTSRCLIGSRSCSLGLHLPLLLVKAHGTYHTLVGWTPFAFAFSWLVLEF